MATLSKAEAAASLQKQGIARKSFNIKEFCARNNISEGLYRRLRADGLGPREIRLYDRIIISDTDEAAWIEKRRKTTGVKVTPV
jgi:hypothetical protein